MSSSLSYSFGSMLSSSSDGHSVDSSFISTSSSGSAGYEIESDVGREALKEICCSALSRVLDFPDNQLEILLGYDDENDVGDTGGGNVAKNLSSGWRNMRRGIRSLYHHHHQSHIYQVSQSPQDGAPAAAPSLKFGSPLCEVDHVVLLQLVSHINMFSTSEGLFRKSGNKNRMEQLIRELQEGKLAEVVLNKSYNAHDFASVLKQYLSELPEPLLLKRHLSAYLQTIDLSSVASIIHCLQLLMLLLPPAHRMVLQHLLDLLCQVTRCPSSKMDARNLSLIFAPTLFLASSTEQVLPEDYEKFSKLLNYMIENAEEIFEVPSEVQVVADRYFKKLTKKRDRMSASMSSRDSIDGIIAKGATSESKEQEEEEEELVIDVYSTSCKRQCVENFHDAGKERAVDEVAKLFEFVKNMPDGPQKAHFMKKFESAKKAGTTTPTSVVKTRKESSLSRLKRSLKRNKENATPKITRDQIQLLTPCFTKGSLMTEFDKAEDSNPKVNDSCSTPSSSNGVFKTPGTIRAVPMRCVPTGLPPPSPSTAMLNKTSEKTTRSIVTKSMYVTDV